MHCQRLHVTRWPVVRCSPTQGRFSPRDGWGCSWRVRLTEPTTMTGRLSTCVFPRAPGKLRLKSASRWALVGSLLLAGGPVWGKGPEGKLPPKFREYPYSVMSLSVGHPNQGHQIRAKKLADTPHLVVKKSSSAYRYGHPALVLMLRRSAKELGRDSRGIKMLVGDLSREHGGPLAGHRSHQSGRDADVGFYAVNSKGKSVQLDRFVKFGADGVAFDGSGLVFDDYRNWLLVQSWVTDTRAGLSHIFVSHGLRQRLLQYASRQARFQRHVERAAQLLKQPEYGEPHDDHFHVRIACPQAQIGLCFNESVKR
jgi:murein endopeptidase